MILELGIEGLRFLLDSKFSETTQLLMDDDGGSEASELSLEELKDEYSSRPPEIAEWLWCIEYVAKFVKYDIRCIIGNFLIRDLGLWLLCMLRSGVNR